MRFVLYYIIKIMDITICVHLDSIQYIFAFVCLFRNEKLVKQFLSEYILKKYPDFLAHRKKVGEIFPFNCVQILVLSW